jgi:uncharacterized membrane protein (DUF4010 family)
MQTSDPTIDLLIQAAYAVAIGLFIGLEREHHRLAEDIADNETPKEHDVHFVSPLGVRTFALISLFGWITGFVGQTWPWLPAVGFMAVGALVGLQYVLGREHDLGLTTEAAALIAFVLGMLVNIERALAVPLALATALLLMSKPWMHALIGRVRRMELSGTLQLLILLAIVLPLLPEQPLDPWNALPPRKIGLFVALIAGIGYVGYFLSRIMGERRGAGLTGIVGGLTSSTAVTIAMAKASGGPGMRAPAQMAVFLANSIMFIRVIVITALLSPAVAVRLAVPMASMGLVMLAGGVWKWRVAAREAYQAAELSDATKLRNPFELIPAIKWGLVLSAVLLLAVIAQDMLGDQGVYAAAALSGVADVDAITLAVAKQAGDGALAIHVASLGVTIAVICNTLVKGGIALFSGGRAFGWHVLLVFGLTIVAGGAAALLSGF